MSDKNLQLVRAIEKFPCIYNHNLIEYSRKDLSDQAWKEIANQTQMTVPECKEKWKNLRYGLLRSLKLNPDGTFKKKYYLHDEMEFIIPFMKTAKYQEILPLEEVEEVSLSNDYEENSPQAEVETEPQKKRSRPSDKGIKFYQHRPSENYEESRRYFLLSLLPEVNELSEPQMRIFRRKVLSLLEEIVEGNEQYDRLIINWNRDSMKQESL